MDIVLSGKGPMTLPALSYPCYESNTLKGPVDGVGMSTGDCGRLVVNVNSRAKYRLRIEFREPCCWRPGEFVSDPALQALTVLVLRRSALVIDRLFVRLVVAAACDNDQPTICGSYPGQVK